ncbi:hypothetical protein GCM10017687_31370 [Streptomyces echinatus]
MSWAVVASGVPQGGDHLGVAELLEVVVPLAHRGEGGRAVRADDRVGLRGERVQGVRGADRYGEDEAGRVRGAGCGAGRRAAVAPVARPSSTTITVRPFRSGGGRSPR